MRKISDPLQPFQVGKLYVAPWKTYGYRNNNANLSPKESWAEGAPIEIDDGELMIALEMESAQDERWRVWNSSTLQRQWWVIMLHSSGAKITVNMTDAACTYWNDMASLASPRQS